MSTQSSISTDNENENPVTTSEIKTNAENKEEEQGQNQSVETNTSASELSVKKEEKHKVDILLKPTANAPIMKRKKWSVEADKPVGWIIEFIKKYLKLDSEEQLFLYINQTFAPSPDQTVRNLYNCHSTEGTLVLHYCKTQAWG